MEPQVLGGLILLEAAMGERPEPRPPHRGEQTRLGQGAQGGVVGCVVVEGALAAGGQQTRVDQTLEMVAERRGSQLDVPLDVAGRWSSGSKDIEKAKRYTSALVRRRCRRLLGET